MPPGAGTSPSAAPATSSGLSSNVAPADIPASSTNKDPELRPNDTTQSKKNKKDYIFFTEIEAMLKAEIDAAAAAAADAADPEAADATAGPNATVAGADYRLSFTSDYLPKCVRVKDPPYPNPVWRHFFELTTPLADTTGGKVPKKGVGRFMNAGQVKIRTFTHLCKICLELADSLEYGTFMSWSKSKCNIANTSNAENHLRFHIRDDKHRHEDAVRYFEAKGQKKRSSGALDSGGGALKTAMVKAKAESVKMLMAKWLIYNHLPHSITQTREFKDLMRKFDPTFVPFHRTTFVSVMNDMFNSMIAGIVKLLEENKVYGSQAVSITHDLWTTFVMDGVLGSSMRLVSREMEVYTIATILKKHNLGHDAETVANRIQELYMDRYKLDVKKEVPHVGSDTTGAARNVSSVLESEQVRRK